MSIIDEFFEQGIRHFYSKGAYDDVKIEYAITENIYQYALDLSPCEQFTHDVVNNKKTVEGYNGICVPCYNIKDGINVVINVNVFKMDQYTAYGTFQHETTHAHDFAMLADYFNCRTFEELINHEDYGLAINFLSEFNARKNGFSYVRKLAYNFCNDEEEKKSIENELKLILKSSSNIKSIYDLAQLFGRLVVIDKYSECKVKIRAYEYLKELSIFDSCKICDKYFEVYDILYKHKNDTRLIVNCLEEVKGVLY